MKRLFVCLTLIVLLTSCTEKFEFVDPMEFNEKIANRKDIKNGEELIKVFYNYPQNEGIPNLAIESKKLGQDRFEITLIHDGLEDDSQRATKIVMTAEHQNETWIVLEVKRNRKCYDGRGHTSWGTEWCN